MRHSLVAGCLLVLYSALAGAHEVRPAYLQIAEVAPQQFEVLWKQPVMADRRLPIEPVLPAQCERGRLGVPEHTGSALIESWVAECDMASGVIHISGLSSTLTDVMVRITYLDGGAVNHMLRPSSPRIDLADASPAVSAYFVLGVEHLLFGIDHILFVIGLVLFINGPWTLIKTITAFTAAHSITLALSVLELVKLPPGPVEAVIALSIVFLARELMVPEAARSRATLAAPWIMAFAFGLLHGFGFAGALADIGLPGDQLALSLLFFNLGIEAGQLAVVAVMLTGGFLVRELLHGPSLLMERGFSAAMGCVAASWTISRVVALA